MCAYCRHLHRSNHLPTCFNNMCRSSAKAELRAIHTKHCTCLDLCVLAWPLSFAIMVVAGAEGVQSLWGGFVGQVAEFGSRSEAANADCACEEVPGAPQLCESLFSQVFEHEASGVRARAHSEVSRLKLHLFSVRERTRSS